LNETLDECVSINIVEKYKVISLGGHNQATEIKRKITKNNTSGLDWDINARLKRLNSKHLGWSD